MFEGAVARLEDSAAAVKRQLRTSESLRDSLATAGGVCATQPACAAVVRMSTDPPDNVEWRIIDHCSAVTRLYALYEQFAHAMIREHLALLERQALFTELASGLQNAYRTGVARILERKEGGRYDDIVLTDLLGEFHKAASGQAGYRLEPKALLIHEQNLRLPVLDSLYQKCGVGGLSGWVANHPEMIQFFSLQDRMHSSAEVELRSLIDYRNDAAHGGLSVDDVLATDALCEFADFICVLCEVLAERVQLAALESGLLTGRTIQCGIVDEIFEGGRIAIATVQGTFVVGASLYLRSDTRCSRQTVESIQLNGVNHENIEISPSEQLGIRLSGRARVGQGVFQYSSLEADAVAATQATG